MWLPLLFLLVGLYLMTTLRVNLSMPPQYFIYFVGLDKEIFITEQQYGLAVILAYVCILFSVISAGIIIYTSRKNKS